MAGARDAQLGNGLGVLQKPRRAGLLESRLQDMAMARFDQPGTDRQPQLQRPREIELVQPTAHVTPRRAHWRFFLRHTFGFLMRVEFRDHFLLRSAFEPLLLRAQPLPRTARPAALGRRSQILAGVVVIQKEVGLLAKDFPALEGDPLRPSVNTSIAEAEPRLDRGSVIRRLSLRRLGSLRNLDFAI